MAVLLAVPPRPVQEARLQFGARVQQPRLRQRLASTAPIVYISGFAHPRTVPRPRPSRPTPPDKTMTSPQRLPASRLEALLRARQFVITAEITPPVSCDADDLLRKAQPLSGLADAVNVTDGASARAPPLRLDRGGSARARGHGPPPPIHLPRPQPDCAAGRSYGRRRLRRAQPLVPHRRQPEGRRPAAGQGGVRRRFDHADGHGARP